METSLMTPCSTNSYSSKKTVVRNIANYFYCIIIGEMRNFLLFFLESNNLFLWIQGYIAIHALANLLGMYAAIEVSLASCILVICCGLIDLNSSLFSNWSWRKISFGQWFYLSLFEFYSALLSTFFWCLWLIKYST